MNILVCLVSLNLFEFEFLILSSVWIRIFVYVLPQNVFYDAV